MLQQMADSRHVGLDTNPQVFTSVCWTDRRLQESVEKQGRWPWAQSCSERLKMMVGLCMLKYNLRYQQVVRWCGGLTFWTCASRCPTKSVIERQCLQSNKEDQDRLNDKITFVLDSFYNCPFQVKC